MARTRHVPFGGLTTNAAFEPVPSRFEAIAAQPAGFLRWRTATAPARFGVAVTVTRVRLRGSRRFVSTTRGLTLTVIGSLSPEAVAAR